MSRARTSPSHVFWKAAPDSRNLFTGGMCPPDQVPADGLVDRAPLPRDIVVSDAAETPARAVLFSPPVFGSRKVYQLRALRDPALHEAPTLGRLHRAMTVYTQTWKDMRGVTLDKENWWWAHHDGPWRPADTSSTRLLRMWAGPMIQALIPGHPDLDALLDEWNAQVACHLDAVRARTAPKRAARTRYGALASGQLVLSARPHSYANGEIHQVFRLQPFGHRRQLGRHTGRGMRCKGPVDAHPVCPAWVRDAGVPPVVAAAALICLADQRLRALRSASAHAALEALSDLQDPLAAVLDAWDADRPRLMAQDRDVSSNSVDSSADAMAVAAAHTALTQFVGSVASLPHAPGRWVRFEAEVLDTYARQSRALPDPA